MLIDLSCVKFKCSSFVVLMKYVRKIGWKSLMRRGKCHVSLLLIITIYRLNTWISSHTFSCLLHYFNYTRLVILLSVSFQSTDTMINWKKHKPINLLLSPPPTPHPPLPHRDTQLERKIIIGEYNLSSYNFAIIFYVMAIAINGIPELLDFKLLWGVWHQTHFTYCLFIIGWPSELFIFTKPSMLEGTNSSFW